MIDVSFKRFDELDSYGGQFLYAAKGLGVTAWGMNVLQLPANWDGYPEHDHEDGQEEVYVALDGSATLESDGEKWQLEPGTLARVGPRAEATDRPGA